MSIKIPYYAVVSSADPVNDILKQRLPVAVSLELIDVADKLQDALVVFNKAKALIAEQHALKDAEGKPVHPREGDTLNADGTVTPGDGEVDVKQIRLTQEGIAKVTELLKTEVTLEVEKISRKSLEGVKIEPATLRPARWLFE